MTDEETIARIRGLVTGVRLKVYDLAGAISALDTIRDLCSAALPDRLYAISLWQPWASAIALGSKRIETRSWPTNHRGPLAIHAGKKQSVALRECANDLADTWVDELAGLEEPLPRGAIVATCRVVDCVLMSVDWISKHTAIEIALGDFKVGRWGWVLEDVRALRSPVPLRGQQGLWALGEETASLVLAEAKEE